MEVQHLDTVPVLEFHCRLIDLYLFLMMASYPASSNISG